MTELSTIEAAAVAEAAKIKAEAKVIYAAAIAKIGTHIAAASAIIFAAGYLTGKL